jgi:hypothetical protein
LCYDKPDETLRTIILPPDPLPLKNPRVPDFAYEQQTVRITQFANVAPWGTPPWGTGPGMVRALQDLESSEARTLQYLTETGTAQGNYNPIEGLTLGVSDLGDDDLVSGFSG